MSDAQKSAQALSLKAQNPSWGYIRIGAEIGWHKDKVRRAIEHAERRSSLTTLSGAPPAVDFYETACRALEQAKTVDQAKDGMDRSEAIRVYARRAKNYQMEADAYAIREKYERKLGLMLTAAKASGQLSPGQPPKVEKNGSAGEQFSRIKLEDYDIDRKLSMRSQKKGGIAERAFEAMVARKRAEIAQGHRAPDVLSDVSTEGKKERRATRERVLGGIQCALPTQKFGVILADPEWRFEPWSRATGMDRAADNHYPTSVTEVIAARDVAAIAADDSALFLYATVPMLPHALTVMSAWGFDYRSHVVWAKRRDHSDNGLASTKPAVGTGYWFRNCHELLLLGVRGKIPAPAIGEQWLSLIEAAIGKHSEKPECFLEMIEEYFPSLPKIELNRRGPARPGWSAWGNEAGEQAA